MLIRFILLTGLAIIGLSTHRTLVGRSCVQPFLLLNNIVMLFCPPHHRFWQENGWSRWRLTWVGKGEGVVKKGPKIQGVVRKWLHWVWWVMGYEERGRQKAFGWYLSTTAQQVGFVCFLLSYHDYVRDKFYQALERAFYFINETHVCSMSSNCWFTFMSLVTEYST